MTTYFAQSSSNINASNVWNTAANGSGTALTWPPASGDVLMANNKTITVNVDTNLGATGEVRNDTTSGATAGGGFTLSASVTLTANMFAGSATCVTFSTASPAVAHIVGNGTGGTSANAFAWANTGTGTLYVNGNLTGGSAGNAEGARNSSSGTVYLTGDCTAGVGSPAFQNASTGTITITGNATGGQTVNIYGANNVSTGTMNITGNATGGIATNAVGAINISSGTLTVGKAIGNGFGNGSVGLGSAPGVSNSQTGTCIVKSIQYGARGQTPTVGPIFIEPDNGNQAIFVKSDLTTLTLSRTDGTDFGNPPEADVRYGTSYALGSKTGTCHVPTASQVSAGIAVDHTTGTAVITEANVKAAIWDAATSSLTTAGSIGERLKNCATVESTGEQLEGLI